MKIEGKCWNGNITRLKVYAEVRRFTSFHVKVWFSQLWRDFHKKKIQKRLWQWCQMMRSASQACLKLYIYISSENRAETIRNHSSTWNGVEWCTTAYTFHWAIRFIFLMTGCNGWDLKMSYHLVQESETLVMSCSDLTKDWKFHLKKNCSDRSQCRMKGCQKYYVLELEAEYIDIFTSKLKLNKT